VSTVRRRLRRAASAWDARPVAPHAANDEATEQLLARFRELDAAAAVDASTAAERERLPQNPPPHTRSPGAIAPVEAAIDGGTPQGMKPAAAWDWEELARRGQRNALLADADKPHLAAAAELVANGRRLRELRATFGEHLSAYMKRTLIKNPLPLDTDLVVLHEILDALCREEISVVERNRELATEPIAPPVRGRGRGRR